MLIEEVLKDGKKRKLSLLKNKDNSGYQFINIEKKHICPCKFNSKEEALKDLDKYIKNGKIKKWEIIEEE